jgi:hypothetical protein
MGAFELEIELRTYVCSKTGKPYIRRYHNSRYDADDDIFEKIYDLPVVPEKYRRYVYLCGKYFYSYVEKAADNPHIGSAHVSAVLGQFPSWETILHHTKYFPLEDRWTEEDHNEFKEFLLWCLDEEGDYHVKWYRD